MAIHTFFPPLRASHSLTQPSSWHSRPVTGTAQCAIHSLATGSLLPGIPVQPLASPWWIRCYGIAWISSLRFSTSVELSTGHPSITGATMLRNCMDQLPEVHDVGCVVHRPPLFYRGNDKGVVRLNILKGTIESF
jgi:hypothetical protein